MRGSGDTPNLSGDYSGEDTILSGEAASKSPGTGELFLPVGMSGERFLPTGDATGDV